MLLFEGITSHESNGQTPNEMEFASGRYNENLRPTSEAFEAKLQNKPKRPTNFHGSVVQLVRTLACHARGRGFEPHPNRHCFLKKQKISHNVKKAN